MENNNHQFMHRVLYRFLPSSLTSCQFQKASDVVENSFHINQKNTRKNRSITKNSSPKKKTSFSSRNKHKKLQPLISKSDTLWTNDVLKASKLPKALFFRSDMESTRKCSQKLKIKNGSSSNSGWFSSEEGGGIKGETDTFLSLSSGSSATFRRNMSSSVRKTGKTGLRKGDDGTGWCSVLNLVDPNDAMSELSRRNNTSKTCRRPTEAGGYSFVKQRKEKKTSEVLLMACPNDNYSSDAADSSGRKTRKTGRSSVKDDKNSGSSMSLTELYYNDSRSTSRKKANTRRKTKKGREVSSSAEMVWRSMASSEARFEESYAVERSSNDPYNDFRASMVEMIMEKQIFGAEDLERLLQCFLSLNSYCFHQVIIEAFTDICDVLFSN